MSPLTRRDFVASSSAFAGLGLTTLAHAQSAALTAGEVVDRIKKEIGVPVRAKTVDNLLTGTRDTPVRGIATTMMATLDVIERCVAQGKNLIVTHETPFYLHQDVTDDIKDDPVLKYKLDFCTRNNVAILHLHDQWHDRHPDGIAQGMVQQLGWQKNVVDAANPKKLTFNGQPLARFAQSMQTTLKAHTMRVLGDPTLPVHNVVTSWGFCGREGGIKLFSQPDTDVLICGETREWELVEYCQDSIRSGNRKALIVVGHVLSEQGGMILCSDWLKPLFPGTPVAFVPATEPFWNPSNPVAL